MVIAPDKFKGSLTAVDVADALARGVFDARPQAEVIRIPVADGGEGTVESAVTAGFEVVKQEVTGPLGDPVQATFAVKGSTAVVELAEASGLPLVAPGQLRPLRATTRGTGELIKHALDLGCTEIVLGVGGSASTDGGAGLLQGLGVSLRDADGRELPGGGGALIDLHSADISGLDPRLKGTTLTLASDVTHLMLGPKGAAAVFGPQKGASPEDVETLEKGLERYLSVLAEVKGECVYDAASSEGSGAAGGSGFAAIALLGAVFRPGIDVMLKLVDFDARCEAADLVITGEGSLDQASLGGKAPVGVAARASKRNIPVVAVAGITKLNQDDLTRAGFDATYSLLEHEPDLHVCMHETARLLREVAARISNNYL